MNQMTEMIPTWRVDDVLSKPITKFTKAVLHWKGLIIDLDYASYLHEINDVEINCPHLVKYISTNCANTENKENKVNTVTVVNPLKCSIYNAMKNDYQYNEENYLHLTHFNHFNNGYKDKPECKYGQKCYAFTRIEKNTKNDYKFSDQCHLAIYRHPPRSGRWCSHVSNTNSNDNKSADDENNCNSSGWCTIHPL